MNATESDRFRVEIVGDGTGFDAEDPWSWKIIDSASGLVTGYQRNKFTVDTSNFGGDLQGGSFMVTESGGDLYVEFQMPSMALLGTNGVEIALGDATPSAADASTTTRSTRPRRARTGWTASPRSSRRTSWRAKAACASCR